MVETECEWTFSPTYNKLNLPNLVESIIKNNKINILYVHESSALEWLNLLNYMFTVVLGVAYIYHLHSKIKIFKF